MAIKKEWDPAPASFYTPPLLACFHPVNIWLWQLLLELGKLVSDARQ